MSYASFQNHAIDGSTKTSDWLDALPECTSLQRMLRRLVFRSRSTIYRGAVTWQSGGGPIGSKEKTVVLDGCTIDEIGFAQCRRFASWRQAKDAAAANPHEHLLNRFRDLCRALTLKGKRGDVKKEIQLRWDDATQSLLKQGLDSVDLTAPQMAKLLNYCREGHYVSKTLTDGLLKYALSKPDFADGFKGKLLGATIKCFAQLSGLYGQDAVDEDKNLERFLVNLVDSGKRRGVFASDSMGARELANCIHTLGLVFPNKRKSLKQSDEKQADGPKQGLPNSGIPIEEKLVEAVEEMAVEFCEKATMSCEPQLLAKALLGCAQIGLTDPKTVKQLTRVLQLNLANYGIYGGYTIAHILQALHGLGSTSEDLIRLLGEHAKFAAPDLTPDQLCANIRGFGRVGFGRSDVVGTLAKTLSKKHNVMELTEGQIASTVKALGSVGYSSKDVLLAFGDEILKDYRMSRTTPHQLGNIMLGYGGAGFYSSLIMARVMGDIVERFEEFNVEDSINVVHGLGMVRLRMLYDKMTASATKFLELFAERIKKDGVGGVAMGDLCRLAWGYGEMGYIDKEMMDVLTGGIVELIREGGDISDKDLTLVLEGCANIMHPCSKDFMEIVREWVRKRLSRADDPHLVASILRSKAVMDDLVPWDYDQFCLRLLELQSRGSCLNRPIMDSLEDATMHAIVVHEHNPNKKILAQLKDVRESDVKEEVRFTRLLKNIVTAMKEIGVQYKVGERIEVYPGGSILVDVYVEGKDRTRIAVLCETQQQYSMNDPDGEFQLMGGAIFRKRLLEKLGYQVVNASCYLTKVGRKTFIVESLSTLNCITMNG
ncbi:hypothetical protein BSKO_11959 [Bryopsis sp. KO-2023]|nr:hypothetical protein BSKO_11959 [Bryopsis sp. KO-2023]